MTTNPEREALARLIDAHYDDYEPVYNEGGEAVSSTLADAILASDVWRNRQAEGALASFVREAGLTSIYGRLHGDEVAQLNEILGGMKFAARPVITDEMVERAQIAMHEFSVGYDVPLSERQKGITRQAWRCALEAAFGEN